VLFADNISSPHFPSETFIKEKDITFSATSASNNQLYCLILSSIIFLHLLPFASHAFFNSLPSALTKKSIINIEILYVT